VRSMPVGSVCSHLKRGAFSNKALYNGSSGRGKLANAAICIRYGYSKHLPQMVKVFHRPPAQNDVINPVASRLYPPWTKIIGRRP
jgi:hypothetical protein